MAMTENTPAPTPKSVAPKQQNFSISAIAAYGVAVIGIVLIVVAGVYMYSRMRSGSDVGDFAYTVSEAERDSYLGRTVEQVLVRPVNGETPVPLELTAPDVAQFASLYPGDQLNPKYWSEPEWAGSDPFGGPTIPDEFTPVLSTDLFRDFDPSTNATRIRIPSIKLDSTVAELGIVSLDDQASYQTPDNTVGHIHIPFLKICRSLAGGEGESHSVISGRRTARDRGAGAIFGRNRHCGCCVVDYQCTTRGQVSSYAEAAHRIARCIRQRSRRQRDRPHRQVAARVTTLYCIGPTRTGRT